MTNFKDIIKLIKDFSKQKTQYKRLFFSNALAGEVGEYCNLIKKYERGDISNETKFLKFRNNIRDELADIFIYLVLNSRVNEIDLEYAILDKIKTIEKRLKGDNIDRKNNL